MILMSCLETFFLEKSLLSCLFFGRRIMLRDPLKENPLESDFAQLRWSEFLVFFSLGSSRTFISLSMDRVGAIHRVFDLVTDLVQLSVAKKGAKFVLESRFL